MNTFGILGLLFTAVWAGGKWSDIMTMQTTMKNLCAANAAEKEKQVERDNQQDRVIQMMNEGLVRIEGNTNTIRQLLQYHIDEHTP